MALTDKLTNIANAIRNKTNTTEAMTLDEMPLKIESIETGGGEPLLQDKSIEIIENGTQTITADSGYDGLNKVEITTNIASSGETPEIGIVPTAWNTSGYMTEITTYGIKNIPKNTFYSHSDYSRVAAGALQKITLNDEITFIGDNGFRSCTNLTTVNISPSSKITYIGGSAFYSCVLLNIKTLPDKIATIYGSAFYNCQAITQMSMNGIKTITGDSSSNGAFRQCKNLKAVWLGSSVTSSGIGKFAFYNCSNLQKIYINLPRATVEAMTGYTTYTFTGGVLPAENIICNDDEGFLTKEEFDAIDWSTYTG